MVTLLKSAVKDHERPIVFFQQELEKGEDSGDFISWLLKIEP
jgi:hypothetical protein